MSLEVLRERMLRRRDAIAPSRTMRVRVGGTVLENDDGSHPRVSRLGDSARLLVPGVSETSTVFRVRLVGDSLPGSSSPYELSFDGGLTWQPVRLLDSAYRDAGNSAWIFTLERGA